MKATTTRITSLLMSLLWILTRSLGATTSFPYEGLLFSSDTPATGTFNLRFRLFDGPGTQTPGVQVGPTVTTSSLTITDGRIFAPLDFGPGAFDGSDRWLEIEVQRQGDSVWTRLTPRQQIQAVPYSIHASVASLFDGRPPADFAPASGSTEYVSKDGDQMLGGLNLPANGLTIGPNQLTLANGNVGIGTTPAFPLHIRSDQLFPHLKVEAGPGAIYGAFLSLDATAVSGGKNYHIFSSAGQAGEGQGNLVFQNHTDGKVGMVIGPAGNVGIGTTAPAARLHVNDPSAVDLAGSALSGTLRTSSGILQGGAGSELALASFGFKADPNSVSLGIRSRRVAQPGANPVPVLGLTYDVDNTVQAGAGVWLSLNGNVGIGTSTPEATLHLGGDLRLGTDVNGRIISSPGRLHIQSDEKLFLNPFGQGDVVVGGGDGQTDLSVIGNVDLPLGNVVSLGGRATLGSVRSEDGSVDGAFIELKGNGYGQFIDFANDLNPDTDYDARIILNPNGELSVQGATLEVRKLKIIRGADIAEGFTSPQTAEVLKPGMVVRYRSDGSQQIELCDSPTDRTVAGVISDAGGISSGLVLEQLGSLASGEHKVAMMGRVQVWADASYGEIRVGDLLVSSPTAGHAMRAQDSPSIIGAIIGKATSNLDSGRAMIWMHVSLR